MAEFGTTERDMHPAKIIRAGKKVGFRSFSVHPHASYLYIALYRKQADNLVGKLLRIPGMRALAGLATLLFDLLTKHEQPIDEITRQLRFDIPLLSQRLTGVIDQLSSDAQLRELRIGLFGASTGAAAALTTAASRPADIAAVVSRGGRVDLAEPSLARVHAASLFIVGSRDLEVLELNRAAAARLQCEHQLVVVPGASHLFEEHGTLEEVARLAGDWFVRHLC